ncbi:MAG TPA: hypothetical protein DCE78_02400 [Bacteroidetes bacterium]|nr:hypothetical protein [Bacteroidota bacterium]
MIERFFKRSQDEIDEDVNEINFSLGNSISKGIPWSEFSEVEIQGILKIHFERLGYDIIWRHREDPANEKGIDLECSHKITQKKILIAVKKKPKVNDLGQVLQLSQHSADHRIYLYLNGAAQSFRDQIIKFEPTIEFWDETKLEFALNESHLAIWIKIDNSNTIQAINKINRTLFTAIKSPSGNTFPKPNKKMLETLWDLKDRAVTLSKCATLIQFMFEDSKRFGEINYQQIQDLQMWCLDFLYTYSLISLLHSFDALSEEWKRIFAYTYEGTKSRSNWYMLVSSIHTEYVPGNVEKLIQHKSDNISQKNESTESDINEKIPTNSELREIYFNNASNQFRCIGIWADGLEFTINDIFKECLSEIKIK